MAWIALAASTAALYWIYDGYGRFLQLVLAIRRSARQSDQDALSDGNGDFAKAVGLDTDSSAFGMGVRSRRYAMILDDCVVQALHVEPAAGQAVESGAEAMLAEL